MNLTYILTLFLRCRQKHTFQSTILERTLHDENTDLCLSLFIKPFVIETLQWPFNHTQDTSKLFIVIPTRVQMIWLLSFSSSLSPQALHISGLFSVISTCQAYFCFKSFVVTVSTSKKVLPTTLIRATQVSERPSSTTLYQLVIHSFTLSHTTLLQASTQYVFFLAYLVYLFYAVCCFILEFELHHYSPSV